LGRDWVKFEGRMRRQPVLKKAAGPGGLIAFCFEKPSQIDKSDPSPSLPA
jgi:hypothetical protein